MSSELRDSGISVVGDVPWGTHVCHFYETKQDLLDILVPYFKTGLESNECCLWVVSDADLITIEEATRALAEVVPDLERQLSNGNIEILNALEWYLDESVFNLERVTNAWDAKLKLALAQGYDGLRVSGDTCWLGQKDWKDFCDYEKQLNDSITDQPMTVLCTYPLAKSAAAEILDVVQAHQFAIARRQGQWEVIQSPEPPQARAEIKRLNRELNRVLDQTPEPPAIFRYSVAVLAVVVALTINRLLNINMVGAPAMLFLCALMFSAWYGGAKPSLLAMPVAVLGFAYYFVTPVNSWTVDVREIPRLLLFVLASLFVIALSAAQKRAAESLRHARDVLAGTVEELKRTNQALRTENTERELAEEALRKSENLWRTIFNDAAIGIAIVNPEGRPVETNPTIQKILGYTREELRHLWFVDFTHPDDTIKEFPLHQEMIEGKRDHYQMEKRYIRKDGQVRWVNLIASVIPAEQPGEFFGVGMVEDITERKLAEIQLQDKSHQLRALSARFESAQEEESKRIAREIHDELGAKLSSLRWDLEDLRDSLADSEEKAQPAGLVAKIAAMMHLTDSIVNTVRRIVSELRPVALDTLGLSDAIRFEAQQFQARTGVAVECRCGEVGYELSAEQATAIFRIFQEALTNILRHAEASAAEIELKKENGTLILTIEDNGRGITEEENWNRRTLGLLGMRERAHLLGGKIDITGIKGRGTAVVLRIPTVRNTESNDTKHSTKPGK